MYYPGIGTSGPVEHGPAEAGRPFRRAAPATRQAAGDAGPLSGLSLAPEAASSLFCRERQARARHAGRRDA